MGSQEDDGIPAQAPRGSRARRDARAAYGCAVAAVGVAWLVRWLFDTSLGNHVPFATFFVAVMFAAWWGGLRPSLLAAGLGLVLAWWFFVPSRNSFAVDNLPAGYGLILYLLASLTLAGLGGAMHDARRRLAEEKERLRTTLASIGDAVITTDTEVRIASMNAVAEALTGWNSADAVGQPLDSIFRIVNEDTRRPVENPAKRALREGIIVGLANHTILLAKDGTEWPIDDSAAPIRGANGEITGCVLVFRDISARKRADEGVRASEERFRLAADAVNGIIYECDLRTGLVERSRGLHEVVGYRPEEVPPTGAWWTEQIHPDDRERVVQVDPMVVRPSAAPVEYRFRHRDGRWLYLEDRAVVVRDEKGKPIRLIGSTMDVTERKRAEQGLEESRKSLYELIERCPFGIYIVDDRFRIASVNAGSQDKAFANVRPLIGRAFDEAIRIIWPAPVATVIIGIFRHTLETGEPYRSMDFVSPRADIDVVEGYEWELHRIELPGGRRGVVCYYFDATRLRQVERQLRDRERRYRLVGEAANDAIWDWDLTTDAVVWNDGLKRAFGYTAEQVGPLASWWSQQIHAEDRERVLQSLHAIIDGSGEIWSGEYRFRRADGSYASVMDRGKVVRENGQPVRMVGSMLDLTERNAAENRLREAEARFRTMADNAPVLIWQTDEAGVTFVNHHYLDFFGQPFEALAGTGWIRFLHPDDRSYLDAYKDAFRERRRYEGHARFRRQDGEHRWLQNVGAPHFAPDGSFVGFVGCSLDVTESRRGQEHQRLLSETAAVLLTTDEPDAMLQRLFAKIAPQFHLDAYFNFMVDDSGNKLRLASCAGVPGEAREALQSIAFGQAICGTVAATLQPVHACRIQESDDPKVRLVRSLGLRVYACSPLMANGELLGTLSFASRSREEFAPAELEFLQTICTYVATAYERLRLVGQLSEANRRKDEFLATLAHELRNPLAPIRNGLQVMKLAGNDAETVEWCREMMEGQLEQMVRLVDDLMDVSRITRGKIELKKQRVELADVVECAVQASRPLIEQMRHELTITQPKQRVVLEADPTRLAQVLSNLLNNAAKYSDRGGRIGLTVRCDGAEVEISVRDTGIGLPADTLTSIFEMFSQVDRSLEKSQGGLGIGLTLVKRLVELHDGWVEARSTGPGQGAEFVVRLPVVVEALAPPSEDGHAAAAGPSSLRIVVIDDNRDGAHSLAVMLKFLGHETHTAYDGQEGVELVERVKPDVVLCDIGLPKLNGYEVCRRIREQSWSRGVCVVAVTGWGQHDDRVRSQEAGFDHHLVKPVAPTALMELLSAFESGRRAVPLASDGKAVPISGRTD